MSILNAISAREVKDLVKDIKLSKPSGIEDVPVRLFKDAALVLLQELTFMFNQSFCCDVFSKTWCIGTITPIPKGGNKERIDNWRPITILPITGTLLEKVVHRQISDYCDKSIRLGTMWGR